MYRDGFYVFRCQSRCVLYGATRVHSRRALSTWIGTGGKIRMRIVFDGEENCKLGKQSFDRRSS